ncbi:MAG: mannitol dehydrogenase family protein [Lachnospiraceae bacterium]|nr:mannitol dehydrogenase family protein [Lachnospiraceae bacterium]
MKLVRMDHYEEWKKKGYGVPEYSLTKVYEETKKNPFWIHFGAGNIFRAFQANVLQNLLNRGVCQRGVIVAEGYDYEIIEKVYRPHDNLGIAVTLKADGSMEKNIVGSVTESLCLDSDRKQDMERLKEIFVAPSLQMATFTITEKGYSLKGADGSYMKDVEADFSAGPLKPNSYMGKVASLLYTRFLAGERPIAMVSMDNCSHNGDKLRSAIVTFAKEWQANGVIEGDFTGYVTNPEKVSFPWTMIDKITPRPDGIVEKILAEDFGNECTPIVTEKKTFVAPFVNAEECEYLVIEDAFPNGREPLEEGGFIFTKREVVDQVEKMKVCTCLNPLHTTLAIFGCLLGYERISEEMKNPVLKSLVEKVGYVEGLPVVVNPGIIDPKHFIDEVVKKRIPNPFMPDTPQRIATDTSQKLGIRFGGTIKEYMKAADKNVDDLTFIPLVLAGWLRYLMKVDDAGNTMELSPDPLLENLVPIMAEVPFGSGGSSRVRTILEREDIFGVNLYESSLGEKVETAFAQMNRGTGAVLETLMKALES